MENSVFAYVRKYGLKQILVILVIMLPMFLLQIWMYQLPKQIIDDAIGGGEGQRYVFGVELERLEYLWLLCAAFLLLVLAIGLIKFIVQTLKGIMAERLLRRLRFQLLARTMRFPLKHFQKVSPSELTTMVTAEAEPLGGFFGEAYILPIFQGGIFLVVLAFLFSQNVVLGIVASMSMPVQAWVIPHLQKRIRLLGKERVKTVRALSDRIGETITGISDLHANDGIRYVQSDFSGRLGKIFNIRYEIYRRKFFMKFLNNFINQLTPFFFYSIGGYLVITNSLSLGALIAGLVAYKDLSAPWKELLNWYQLQADASVKYDMLLEQFQPAGMIAPEQQQGLPKNMPDWRDQTLSLSGVTLKSDGGVKQVNRVSTTFNPGEAVLITGSAIGGKHELALLLSGLIKPNTGQIKIGAEDLTKLHRSVVGCRIAYAGPEGTLFRGSLKDNLLLGLKRLPRNYLMSGDKQGNMPDITHTDFIKEASASGNSVLPHDTNWLSISEEALLTRSDSVLRILDMEDSLYETGLQTTLSPQVYPELAAGLLQARNLLAERLNRVDASDLIRRFTASEFNRYASIAENIIYGQPVDETFAFECLGENDYIHELLEQHGLQQDFQTMGLRLAHLMVELFQGDQSSDFFQNQFSFVDADSLVKLARIVRRYDRKADNPDLEREDQNLLNTLVFQLVPQRHRLDLIDSAMEQRLLALRHSFRQQLPPTLQQKVVFWEEDAYNPGLTVQGNILFGRIAYGRAQAEQRISTMINEIIGSLKLRQSIIRVALEHDVGRGGSCLPLAQRQLLVLARSLMKNPQIIVINEALSALPSSRRAKIARQLIQHFKHTIIIWVDSHAMRQVTFTHRLEMHNGCLQTAGDVNPVDSDSGKTTSLSKDSLPESDAYSTLTSEVRQLQRVPLFSSLSRRHLRLLAFASKVVKFEAGETVFRQHDAGESAFVVLRGQGEVLLEHTSGKQKLGKQKLNDVKENDLVGEMALLGDVDTQRSASFLALNDMECLEISREVFIELIQQNPDTATRINCMLSKRLHETLQLVHL